MAFEITNQTNRESTFRQNFTTEDFEINGYQSDTLQVTLPYGTINGRQWIFDGIRMMYSETDFNRCGEFAWKGDTEMITMHFNLKGNLSLTGGESSKTFRLSNNQHNIFYGRAAEGLMKVEELSMKMFLIQLSKTAFFRIAHHGNDALKRFADAVAGEKAAAFSDISLDMDFSIHNCIQAVLNSPFSDSLMRMYLLSKSIEMLVLQAEAHTKTWNKKETALKSDYDKERILFARDYLLSHLDCPPTLPELSRVAGINEFKLKRGFKETFNVTAFQYLADTRLDIARSELLEKKKTATEIAFELGYSSLQHFSAAFKKKFGVSPARVK
jgi:AraC family transcriptional regulator, transcriptional activator of the genes for pyochelin and ferripyochelin receptors